VPDGAAYRRPGEGRGRWRLRPLATPSDPGLRRDDGSGESIWHTPCNAFRVGTLADAKEPTMQSDWAPKILAAMLALIAVAALTLASTYRWIELPRIHASATIRMSVSL
jgi:hypothetical protein